VNDDLPPWIDSSWTRRFRAQLLCWFEKSHRPLPWRQTSDPYAIWVSEIMLQQTQVATVIGYYERFLQRFPTLRHLAEALEDDVLRAWEGLGYYRRARQLHAAARQIVDQHGGCFPLDWNQIRALPGIGRYTAGAICSFAYDQSTPIVEANTQRLYARLCRIQEPLQSKASQDKLWAFARHVLPRRGPGRLNQAMMELGSQICTSSQPGCEKCPVASLCPTKAENLQASIPVPKAAMRYESITEVVALIRDRRRRWLLRRCGDQERWAGLWDFPRFRVSDQATLEEWNDGIRDQSLAWLGQVCRLGRRLCSMRHGVTRYRILLHCHEAAFEKRIPPTRTSAHDLAWVATTEFPDYALSATGRKISDRLKA
jgi:A/G-specific adenine glycosylase